MLADLAVVVHKADKAEAQGEEVDVQVGKVPFQHPRPAQDKHRDARANDKHDAPHGGRARLGGVPGRTVGPNLLARFQLPQLRNQKFPNHQRQQKGRSGGDQRLRPLCPNRYHFPLPLTGHTPGTFLLVHLPPFR